MSLDAYTHRVSTYRGPSTITFDSDSQEGLRVTIETANLILRSVTQADVPHYARLYGDETVMCNVGKGITFDGGFVVQRIAGWVKQWREGDPYSGLAVFHKYTGVFLGHIVLGHQDVAGMSQLAGFGFPEHWKQKYGTEAATAVVREYAPATVKEGFQIDGKPLESIVATSKLGNIAANQILTKLLKKEKESVEQYGAERHAYTIELSKIPAPPCEKAERSFQFHCLESAVRPGWLPMRHILGLSSAALEAR